MVRIPQVLLLVLVVVRAVYAKNGFEYYNLDDAPKLFDKFVKDFDKVYKNSEDKRIHFEQFKKNLQQMNDLLNGKNFSSIEGINQYADLSKEEIQMYYGVVPRLRSGSEKWVHFSILQIYVGCIFIAFV